MELETSSESDGEFVVQVSEDENTEAGEEIHVSDEEELSAGEELQGSENDRNSVPNSVSPAAGGGSPIAEGSDETIPYNDEEGYESPARLEVTKEAENDADSESSEFVSEGGTPSPPPRKSARGRIPKSIFTYDNHGNPMICLLYTSPSPRDRTRSRMPSSA